MRVSASARVACSSCLFAFAWACGAPAGQERPPPSADSVSPPRAPTVKAAFRVDLDGEDTLADVGDAQGVVVLGGHFYVLGDADTGVIREYDLVEGRLRFTGLAMRLTNGGVDRLPHPTGLTTRAPFGTFVGNTVAKHGTIVLVDWARLKGDRVLDHATVAAIDDDAAVNGSRPEFVRYKGAWVVATSDYGPSGNEVRLYDPARLAQAKKTSEPGVVIARFPCGPWVQSLAWDDAEERLVLVQNRTEGRGWRITMAHLEGASDLRGEPVFDVGAKSDELEGATLLEGGRVVFVSSSPSPNVFFGKISAAGRAGP
jgi:hypothetical protein